MKYLILMLFGVIVLASIFPMYSLGLTTQVTHKLDVKIYSPFDFYLNKTLYSPGTYYISNSTKPLNVTFVSPVYMNSGTRFIYLGMKINGTLVRNESVIIYPNLNYTVTKLTIQSIYVKQYFVSINSEYPIPIHSGWYNSSYTIPIPRDYYYYIDLYDRVVISSIHVNGTAVQSIFVNSPLNVSVQFTSQFYLNFSSGIMGYLNGSLMKLYSNWYNNYTNITIPRYIYLSTGVRYYTYGNFIGSTIVRSPMNLSDIQIEQVYLTFIRPVLGYNGSSIINYTSGWYNRSMEIDIPLYIYINNTTRIITEGDSIGYLYVADPFTINDTQHIQRLINLPYNVEVEYQDTFFSTRSIWIFNGTTVFVPHQIIYLTNVTRVYLPPQWLSYYNYTELKYYFEYYIQVPLRVPAVVNGTNSTLTSGWYGKGTNIEIYTIAYLSSGERLIISSNVYNIYNLSSPQIIRDYYTVQYFVNIRGLYGNHTIYNISLWEPNGTIMYVPGTFLYDGSFFVLNESGGAQMNYTINSPLSLKVNYYPHMDFNITSGNNENVMCPPKYALYVGLAVIISLAVILGVTILVKK